MTITQKNKLKTKTKMEIQTQIESPVPKYETKYCKGIHVRISTKQKTEQSMQKQDEPVA